MVKLREEVESYSEETLRQNYALGMSEDCGDLTALDIMGTWEEYKALNDKFHEQQVETLVRIAAAPWSLMLDTAY